MTNDRTMDESRDAFGSWTSWGRVSRRSATQDSETTESWGLPTSIADFGSWRFTFFEPARKLISLHPSQIDLEGESSGQARQQHSPNLECRKSGTLGVHPEAIQFWPCPKGSCIGELPWRSTGAIKGRTGRDSRAHGRRDGFAERATRGSRAGKVTSPRADAMQAGTASPSERGHPDHLGSKTPHVGCPCGLIDVDNNRGGQHLTDAKRRDFLQRLGRRGHVIRPDPQPGCVAGRPAPPDQALWSLRPQQREPAPIGTRKGQP